MKYRVVHIITSSDIGGAQQHVQDIVTNLNKDLFKPIVICGEGGDFDKKLRLKGIDTYRLESLGKEINLFLDFKTVFELVRLLKDIRPTIVHTHSSKAGLLGRIAAKICGIPIIIFTAHGFVFHEFMTKFKYEFYVLLEKFTSLLTDQIIAVSEVDKAKAIDNKVISTNKIQTIHNGIDVDLFNPEVDHTLGTFRRDMKLAKNDVTVGLIGRLVTEKGVPYFIEAASLVINECPGTKFILVGDGPLKNHLQELVNTKNLSNNFIFTGAREDVKLVLAELDIVIFSSIKEGLPLALLEALSMEKAVVSTVAGGIPEVIKSGQNGLLVPIGDSNEIAKAIITLVKDKNLRKILGRAGRSTVKEKFSLAQMVRRTEKVYLNLLVKKKLL